MQERRLILGLDPGSRFTGFGVIGMTGEQIDYVDHGVFKLPEKALLGERLRQLYQHLESLFVRYKASFVAIEKIFIGKNADSAFKLGHARGVCMLVAAQNQAMIVEYASRYVKKCIVGNGSAEKEHLRAVVCNLLQLKSAVSLDASDALALALTHSRDFAAQNIIARAQGLSL